jgi:hypothetical protein
MKDTRTPLLSNTLQLSLRTLLMALLLGSLGVRAVPLAFAAGATLEASALGTILLVRATRRIAAETAVIAPAPATG